MPPLTLAELRAMPAAKLPTRSERLCLNLDLLGDVQRLNAEKADLIVNALSTEPADELDEAAAESKARVRKASERTQAEPEPESEMPPRVAEIEAELAVLWDEMRKYEGDILLRGIDGNRWQTYKDKHPPRDGHQGDADNGRGVVNTTALMADLGDWAAKWNDEELAPSDWVGLSKQVAPADLTLLVRRVVEMQENRVTIPPKALTGSPSTTSPESAGA